MFLHPLIMYKLPTANSAYFPLVPLCDVTVVLCECRSTVSDFENSLGKHLRESDQFKTTSNKLMFAQYPWESVKSNCCINKWLPLFLFNNSHFKPPLSRESTAWYPPTPPPSPPLFFLSVHFSKDTCTGSLSSSCWYQSEADLHGPRFQTHTENAYLAEGMHLMKSSRAKLMVFFSLSEPAWLFRKIASVYKHVIFATPSTWDFPASPRQRHKSRLPVEEGRAEGIEEVAYDNETKAAVFSEGGCILH